MSQNSSDDVSQQKNVDREAETEKGMHVDDDSNNSQTTKNEVPPMGQPPAQGAPDPAMNPMHPSQFPDGGRQAWCTVIGASCALFISFGWINAIGVFQTYYQQTYLRDYSPSTVAWIPTMEAFMLFFGGSWVGRAYDNYGPKWLLLVGMFLNVFGLMMASLSTQYYQFMLSQGICAPIGAAMVFYPSLNASITWFYKKRAFALGIVVAGSSLGGVIFPIMVYKLIPEVGFPWTMRICAFLILALALAANLLVRSRIPPHPRPVRIMDFISPFTEVPFFLLTLGGFIVFLGLFIPFSFIILQAEARGCDPTVSPYLISMLNAGSIAGRIFPGWAADKLGRFTMFVAMNAVSAILVLALWLPGTGTTAAIVFAILFGFFSGSIISLAPTLIAQISDVRQIGVRSGSMYIVIGTAVLIGSPIGGAILDKSGWIPMDAFAGACMIAGTCIYCVLRWKVGGFNLLNKT